MDRHKCIVDHLQMSPKFHANLTELISLNFERNLEIIPIMSHQPQLFEN